MTPEPLYGNEHPKFLGYKTRQIGTLLPTLGGGQKYLKLIGTPNQI